MYEIEQTDGFVDCQLRKVRMKETVTELYNGLQSVQVWEYFDHLSKPIEMDALLKSFKQQWTSFRNGNGEQNAGSLCKCTITWNKISRNKLDMEKYEDLETTMKDMARYFMTEELHGCPMEYSHGIKLNTDDMDELEDTVGFKSTKQETEPNLAGDEQVECLIKKIVSNIFPFAHLHCQNENEQLFDIEIHKPYIGSCGHTICLVCIEKTSNQDCPVCGKKASFEDHYLNEDLLREIETIKRNAWEIFKEYWNNEAADSGTCSKCNKHSSDLHMCDIDIWTILYSRISIKTTADVLKLSRQTICQECASAVDHVPEKIDSIPFWKSHLRRTNGIFLLELLGDDIGGENCKHPQTRIQKNRRKLIEVWKELDWKDNQTCGYDRDLINIKLIGKLIENIDHDMKQIIMPEKNLFEPIKERNCPLCVMIDFLDFAKNKSEHNRNDWMNVFDHLWSSQSLRFEKCCFRCLLHLNNRYSALCQTKIEVVNIKKMSNAICEGIEEGQLKKFERVLAIADCNDLNIFMSDKQIWENLITREYFFCLLQILTKGLSKITFACYLRKIRFYNLAFHFLLEVCDVWRMNNQSWIVGWKFIKTSNMVKKLNHHFKKLKSEMDKEEIGIKCECTEIWERNQKMTKKFKHEDCEERRKHQDLEDSLEKMARFSLEEDLYGCPMGFNHGIEMDEELVGKFKEATDPEEETNGNKCLCLQIDSSGPNSKISDANLDQIMSFFINWWKYEASYPHLLCHECIYRLELIQNRLETLPGFHNCELRRMRMLKTFHELIMFIREYRMIKGRVFEGNIKWMTKVFDNFISQWNSFRFGSDSDQQFFVPGTVCHCTKTLNANNSLQNGNYSWETKRKYENLMKVSKKLAEFNLTKIISGCPLKFYHNIETKCFYLLN